MTIQKAMRTRAELKKEYARITTIINSINSNDELEIVNPENIDKAKEQLVGDAKKFINDPHAEADGMTLADLYNKLLRLSDEIEKVNIAIEGVNTKGHNLLYKECCLKSKLGVIDALIGRVRSASSEVHEEVSYVDDYTKERDQYGKFPMKEQITLSISTNQYFDTFLGTSLIEQQKTLKKQLDDVRDELTVFNSTVKVDYELPEDL